MKEYSQLDKLNAVAKAENSQRGARSLQVSLCALSFMVVPLAIVARASPVENAAVRILAGFIIATTVCLLAGWRYAAPLARTLFPFGCIAPWLFREKPLDAVGRGFLLVAICCAVVELFALLRLVHAIWLAGRPALESEREQIGRWSSLLTSSVFAPGVIEFTAGDFWTNGPATIRLLQQGDWVLVAYFYRKNLDKPPTLSVFDAQATPILYSPEQRCIRIGKRKLRKVEFNPESVAPAQQFAQVVATV